MSKLAYIENKNDANSVRIQTLISTLINVIVNIIQNRNLMNHMDKIGSSDNLICFSLLHLNIRSLNRHYDNLINCLARIKNRFSVIGISRKRGWLTLIMLLILMVITFRGTQREYSSKPLNKALLNVF